MPAPAAIQSSTVRQRPHSSTAMPTCTVCASSMVAAEASALNTNNVVSYLWSCDVCGYGFVTDYSVGQAPKN